MKQIIDSQEINPVKVAYTVAQISKSGVLHDSIDIDFEGASLILQRYGIFDQFSDAELNILEKYLLGISYKEELWEAVLWAEMELSI